MSRRLLIVAVVPVAALLAAGCGGSDTGPGSDATPPEEWADGLCSAIVTWKDSLTSTVSSLQVGSLSQETLTGAVDEARTATDSFTSDLGDLGKPDIEAGQKAKDTIDQLSTEIQADMTRIEDAVSGASGIAGVLAAVPVIRSALTTAGQQVSTALSGLQDIDAKGELESAFKDSSSCTELTGGS